jgi:MoxR-like ATPase
MQTLSPTKLAATISERLDSVLVGGAPLAEQLLVALTARGHCLLEGVPGTGKTLLGQSFARLVGLPFRRVQLTPDLLPADLTGTLVLEPGSAEPSFRPGPLFTGMLMADEINRAPPRTQSALLEAMEERQITVDGRSRPLEPGFTVIATLNAVETEGTWPLPEAQLDRFALRLRMDYPPAEVEAELLARSDGGPDPRGGLLDALEPALDADLLEALIAEGQRVKLGGPLRDFLLALVHAAREDARVALGPSPRAALQLARLCRARAVIRGRDHVLPDDITILLEPALAHRISLHPEALLDGERAERVLADARARVEVPR